MKKTSLIAVIGALVALVAGCGKGGEANVETPETPTAESGAPAVGIVTKSGVEMVAVPWGSFTMGNDQGANDERPAHRLKVSAFLIDNYEVTHEMYVKAQLPDPSHWKDNSKGPVEKVRWRDAKQYCNERSLLEGLKPCYNEKTADWDCDVSANGYRLPTEAEWEYACRAGSVEPYPGGSVEKLRKFAWYGENSDARTHVGGRKQSNAWGIYDMLGNVSEWCEDVYSTNYYSMSPAIDPTGPPNTGADVRRVIRGGSWKSSADECRITARQGERTGDSDACFSTDYCGFRCVRRATPEEIAGLRPAAQ